MKIINADILKDLDPNRKTIILHGCNCFHVQNAGIAKYLKEKFPQIYQEDLMTQRANKEKLGTFSRAIITPNLHILNCYTQFAFGGVGIKHARYWAIDNAFIAATEQYNTEWSVRMPVIGCGLAGGERKKVKPIIEKNFSMYDLNIYYL